MSHSKLKRLLNDYVDRELPGIQRAEVSAHLEACSECATEVRELERAVSLLRRLPEPALPPGFADAVIERVRAGESTPGWLRGLRQLLQPTLTITATAAVAGLAVFSVVGGGTSTELAGGTSTELAGGTSTELPGGSNADAARPQLDVARVSPSASPTGITSSSSSGIASSSSSGIASGSSSPMPAGSQTIRPSLAPAPIQLAASTRGATTADAVASQMRRQRRALELAQRGHRDAVARTLRGAGHPHSATLAAHFEDHPDSIQLISAEGRDRILRVR